MLELHDILRASTIKRFHIVNTTRAQTLAEHQYGVSVLAGEIAGRMGMEGDRCMMVMVLALYHDSAEAKTGDIPTPIKKTLRREVGAMFDNVLDQYDHPLLGYAAGDIKTILKCADYLESMHFLSEHGLGRHADAVMADILDDALAYFATAGRPGEIANQIWSELQNAVYTI